MIFKDTHVPKITYCQNQRFFMNKIGYEVDQYLKLQLTIQGQKVIMITNQEAFNNYVVKILFTENTIAKGQLISKANFLVLI